MFLHSTEAAHGDLGVISSEDILIIISHSGESDEIIKLFQSLKIIKVLTVLISSKKNSQLAKLVNHSVIYPFSKESCMLNLAPSTSSLIQLEIGHLLAITLSQMRNISKETFSIYHPMGLLGKTLNLKAIHIMKKEENNSIVLLGTPLQDAIIEMASKSIGIVNVVDGYGKLYGIFTDGDLRRFFSTKNHNLSKQIDSICTTNPIVVNSKNYAREVIQIFKNNRIDVAPVIDDKNNLLGTIRLIDLIDAGFEFES